MQDEATSNKVPIDNVVDSRGVPLGNVLAEVTRKLGKMNEINAKLDLVLQGNQAAGKAPTEIPNINMASIDGDIKAYVDSQLAPLKEEKKVHLERAQKSALEQTFKTFPELQTSSDDFDQEFFNLAVEYETKMDASDPQRPMKAAKLAALELGKMEKITKAKLLQDENRRSRIISEGSASSNEKAKPSNKQTLNKSAIKQYFKIDSAKIEQYAKDEE